METILLVFTIFYCIYLNLRVKDFTNEIIDLRMDMEGLDIKVYNKMMTLREESNKLIQEKLKIKTVAKSRRRSTKRSSKVS